MNESRRPRAQEREERKPAQPRRLRGAPLGTHSLTGDPATVGIPAPQPGKQGSRPARKDGVGS
jgi:hypothetical protein